MDRSASIGPVIGARNCQRGFDMRRAVAIAGITILVLALGPVLAPAAGAKTTVAFQAEFKYTFGMAASKPCAHFLCGEGTVAGFGDATSIVDVTSVSPIAETNCFLSTADETITLTSDGSTLRLENSLTVCFPGNSLQAPFAFPFDADGTFTVRHGTGVFQGAKGSGTLHVTAAGDAAHSTFSGTLTLP
jgi:hypothetical protein